MVPVLSSKSAVELPEFPGETPHYLRALTEVGELQEVVAYRDIYASNGIKLLAKGASINRSQFDRLVQHRLKESLDETISLGNAVDAAELAREAGKLLDHDHLVAQIAARTGDARAVRHELARLVLPAQLVTRLTVMRDMRPNLYRHSLRTAMLAFALAQHTRQAPGEYPSVLLAALFHDVGELHTDPAILVTEHRITPEERRYVYVHPITGYLLLKEIKEIPHGIARAVLQHHERFDGSGYPYGLKSVQLSSLAQLLSVAEVSEVGLGRFEPHRMEMLLRVSRSRFSPEILNALSDLIHVPGRSRHELFAELDMAAELANLARLWGTWIGLRQLLEANGVGASVEKSPFNFLYERMNNLRGLILQAGFDPNDIPGIEKIAGDDAPIQEELRDMLCEIDWLLHDLANEIDRRSPTVDPISKVALEELLTELRRQRLTGCCVIWAVE